MSDRAIDIEQVKHVAALARLELRPDELTRLTEELAAIIGYVNELREVDTRDVPATNHAVELGTQLRQDEPRPGLPPDKALANAPEPIDGGFGVPKIIE